MKLTKEVKNKVSVEIVLKSVMDKAAPIRKKLKALPVEKDNLKVVGEQLKLLKAVDAEGTQQMKDIIDPIKEGIKRIQELFQPFFKENKELIELKKRETEQLLLAQANAAAKIVKDAENGKIKKTSTLVSKLAETEVHMNGKTGLGVRNYQVVEIMDESKIPRAFMVPDMAAIKEAMKEGKTVPGCKWSTKQTVTV